MNPVETIGQNYVRLSSRKPARAQAVPVQGNYPPHDHEFYEVCIVTSGRALHRTADGDTWIGRGAVAIIAPGQTHEFAKATGFAVVNAYYLAEWFLAELHGLRNIAGLVDLFFARALFPSKKRGDVMQLQLAEEELMACLHDLRDLQKEWESESAEPVFCEAALLKCMIRITRAAQGAWTNVHSLRWPAVVTRAAEAIESTAKNGQSLELSQVAQKVGVSKSHLCRVFKAITGTSPGGYYQRLRIQRACRSLLGGAMTVSEVAHELGYADCSHFNRSFKAVTGLTPRTYKLRFASEGTGTVQINS